MLAQWTKRRLVLVLLCMLFWGYASIMAEVHAANQYVIKLEGEAGATFQVYNVVNRLSATPLSNEVLSLTTMTISVEGEVYYSGLFTNLTKPVTPRIPIPVDERVQIDIQFSFSEDADNRYQGVPYQLKWYFEARSTEETVMDLVNGSTMYSNLNIDPGDTYGFALIIENGNPPDPEPPDDGDPDDPPDDGDPDDPPSEVDPDDPPDNGDPGEDDNLGSVYPGLPIKPNPSKPVLPDDSSKPSVPDSSEPVDDSSIPDDGEKPDDTSDSSMSSQPSRPENDRPDSNFSESKLDDMPSSSDSMPADDTRHPGGDEDDTTGFGDGRTPAGNLDGLGEDDQSIDTGDYTSLLKRITSVPLLVTSTVFLVGIIGIFLYLISVERKQQAGE